MRLIIEVNLRPFLYSFILCVFMHVYMRYIKGLPVGWAAFFVWFVFNLLALSIGWDWWGDDHIHNRARLLRRPRR